MRINEAWQLSELGKPRQNNTSGTMMKSEIMAQVDTKNTPMIVSKRFVLVRMVLNRLASPIKASADANTEIVADLNVKKLGRTKNGFVPKVIVVSGQNAFQQAHADRRITTHVWLGELAAEALNIKADHLMSSEELRTKLQEQLDMREGPRTRSATTIMGDHPYIRDVYPFENYFIYQKNAKQFRQLFEIDGRTNVMLSGRPIEVVQTFTPKIGPTQRLEAAISMFACAGKAGCSCGCNHKDDDDVKASDMNTCAVKGGKKVTYDEAASSYKMACDKGYKPSMKAVSPPGWSGVTKRMKEHHSDKISNPFALAWWMEDQGYEPHVAEEKKKGKVVR